MANIKDIVENPHPVYIKNLSCWNFYLDSYEGGPDYTSAFVRDQVSALNGNIQVKVNGKRLARRTQTNLFEHPKERWEDYQRRLQMSYYYNFCAPVIDIYTNHLFGESVIEDWGSIEDSVMQRMDNVDNRQSSLSEYRKQVVDASQIFGHTFTLVDSPEIGGDIVSLQQKIDLGVFPYFVHVFPQNVLNWALDRFGSPYWVCIMETADKNEDFSSFDKDMRRGIQYRIWTRQEWILFNSGYEEIGRGTHGLGFVPISVTYDRQSKKENGFLGISFITDISLISRDIYNSCSELKQILRDQTFSILAVQGDATDYPEIEVATNKGLLVPKESQMPQYITPPSGPAEIYMKHIDGQVSKIFQLAKLEGGSASFNGQTAVDQSGVSKAWDFNQTNSALTSKAENMEDSEIRMWQMFAAWEGTDFDGNVTYPREFSVKDLMQDLNEAEKAMRLAISNEFDKEIKKAIVKKKFPRLPEDKMAKIESEIDSSTQTNGDRIASRINGLFNRTPQFAGNNGGFR